jgi:hypothetical protein
MKLRKDDGSELKKGEYEIECGDKLFVLEADEEELQMYATIESEKVRPFMEQNIMQQAQIHFAQAQTIATWHPQGRAILGKRRNEGQTRSYSSTL